MYTSCDLTQVLTHLFEQIACVLRSLSLFSTFMTFEKTMLRSCPDRLLYSFIVFRNRNSVKPPSQSPPVCKLKYSLILIIHVLMCLVRLPA